MPVFEVFDNVEANYKELGKWFSGIIVAVHLVAAATGQFVHYDVAYDDGDSEADVRAENLRAIKKPRRDRGQKKIAAAPEEVAAAARRKKADEKKRLAHAQALAAAEGATAIVYIYIKSQGSRKSGRGSAQ